MAHATTAPPELLTPRQLAERLGVSTRTVIEWSRSGRIPVVKASERIRRFDWQAVLDALRGKGGAA